MKIGRNLLPMKAVIPVSHMFESQDSVYQRKVDRLPPCQLFQEVEAHLSF